MPRVRLRTIPVAIACCVAAYVCGTAAAFAQSTASISGFVRDAETGETLLQAHVYLAGTTVGAVTNDAGYYTLAGLAPGRYTFTVSYVGYVAYHEDVGLAAGQALRRDVDLQPGSLTGEEVVVSASREGEDEARDIGVVQLKTQAVKELPALLEPDVFRSLQVLPGVKAASDFSSGIYVRGGGPDQTLILLDRNTVYNPTHFFGFFSSFNPDAIKDVHLYKGGYPAAYGGRLGAVLDVYNKDGNRRHREGGLSVGLLASRAIAEGPYRYGSWMVAARRSTLEPVLAALRAGGQDNIPDRFHFYDLNGKINFDAGPDDRLSVAFYAGRDRLALDFLDDASLDIALGNTTFSGNWTRVVSDHLFANLTLTSSRYASSPDFYFSGTPFSRKNRVYDSTVKGYVEYIPNRRHNLETGFQAGNFVMRIRDTFDGDVTLDERIQSLYGAAYVQETYRPSPLWMVRAGIRASYFDEGRYLRVEPRLNVTYDVRDGLRLQAAYGRYHQFLTLVSSELFSAFDLWLTTGNHVPPAFGDQYVAGARVRLKRDVTLDVETYYRTMHDLFELDPFLFDAAGLDYDALFRFGQGYAYGTEVQLQKTRGRLSGSVGYTWSRTRRRFPNVNDFRYYAPKYDRTHDLNAVVQYHLGRGWRVAAVFTYATGQAYTEPSQRFELPDYPLASTNISGLVSRFNAARLPAYHRLDGGFSKTGRFLGFADYELQLQVINAYSRRNVWFYFFEFEDDGTVTRTEVPQLPVPLPNVSFSLHF